MVTQRLSLRTDAGSWLGLVDSTDIGPLAGSFREMTNAIVSEDGTEIRPAPGTRLAAQPFHGQSFEVTNVVVGGSTTAITIDATQESAGDAWLLSAAQYVYIDADSADPDTLGVHLATRTGIATFTIPTITSAVAIGQDILIRRFHKTHALATVDGVAAIVVETETMRNATELARNVATTVCSTALSIDSPPGPGFPDGTDTGCVLWPSPTMWALNTKEYAPTVLASQKLRHREVLRRMQCSPLNGRLLIAVPGAGNLFQANVRIHRQTLDIRPPTTSWPDSRWTKMLGIPRGILGYSALTQSNTASGALTADRWFTFAIGYFDPLTGEAGTPSPPKAVHLVAPNDTINIDCSYPRGIAMETAGLQLVLYASDPMTNDSSATAAQNELNALALPLYPHASFGPFLTSTDQGLVGVGPGYAQSVYTFVIVEDPDSSSEIAPRRVPVIEAPPPGASWINVVKSRAVSGGELPAYWDFPAWPVQNPVLGGPGGLFDEEHFLVLPTEWAHASAIKAQGPLALGKIPSAYNGRIIAEVGSYDASGVLTLGTGNTANVGRNIGQDNGQASGVGPHTYEVPFRAGDTTTFNLDNLREYRIFNPADLVSVAEEAEPGVFPHTTKLPVDGLEVSGLTTGSARLGEQMLLFTRRQTYLFGWSSLPQYSSAIVLSNSIGCVSPHSIVEGPGFAAWLSARGPCMSGGGVPQWIGKAVSEFWATVLRDSEGMAICAGSAIDTQRTLVVWAVRVGTGGDWTTATTDQLKAKVPADRLLIWNYTTMSFSVVEREGQRLVDSIGTMMVDDGVDRIAIASAGSGFRGDLFAPIYVFDGVVERGSAVSEFTVTARRDPSTSSIAIADADSTIGTSDWLFVRSSDGSTARYVGQATAVASAAAVTVGSADGSTWNVGDVVVAGGPYYVLRTHRMRAWPTGVKGTMVGVAIHARVDCDHAYAKVSLIDVAGTAHAIGPLWGIRLLDGATVVRGSIADTDVAIQIEVFGDGDVAIRDIEVEVESGSSA